jgi:hypothetical protein
VEVRDLSKGGDVVFNFPTVDQVHQMLHCCHGNGILYSIDLIAWWLLTWR